MNNKINEKLDQWIHNSKVRAEVREIIEVALIDAKGEGFIAGYNKAYFDSNGNLLGKLTNLEYDKLNTNEER